MSTKTKSHPMWMSKELFEEIYGRVPRLSVDLLIRNDEGIVLTKRDIEPCIGQWHMPGGTVFFGERLDEAVRRIAYDEVGAEQVEVGKQLGYIEYVTLCDSPQKTWTVAIVFAVRVVSGKLRGGEQGRETGYFKKLPKNVIKDQAEFLKTIL